MLSIPVSARYLGASFALFAIVGAAHVTFESMLPVLGATALAVAGVYGVARYAGRVPRRRLAVVALGLWLAFLAVAGVHLAGIDAATATIPVADPVATAGVYALTWATLLSAAATTVFLAFREYGSAIDPDTYDESVFDGDSVR